MGVVDVKCDLRELEEVFYGELRDAALECDEELF
jgi:hypothetical protein